ncbi:MAG: hypothetical protein R3E50_17050 [Halioglobus sp.]
MLALLQRKVDNPDAGKHNAQGTNSRNRCGNDRPHRLKKPPGEALTPGLRNYRASVLGCEILLMVHGSSSPCLGMNVGFISHDRYVSQRNNSVIALKPFD